MIVIVEFIYSLLLVLTCNTIFTSLTNTNLYLTEIFVLITILLFVCEAYSKKLRILQKDIGFFIIYIIFILFFLMFNKIVNYSNFVGNYLIILPLSYLILKNSDTRKKIFKNFINICVVLCFISLFFYLFGSLLNIIKPTGFVSISWGDNRIIETYGMLHFNTQHQIIGNYSIWRNSSIFAETPMFSLILTIAFSMELFLKKDSSKFKLILFYVTLITTFSTTGIILSSLAIVLNIFFVNQNKDKYRKLKKVIFYPILTILLIYISYKVFLDKKDGYSYVARMDDYIACFRAWLKYPIIGSGYGNYDLIIENMNSIRITNTGLSNSVMVILAQGGLYIYLLFISCLLKTIKYAKHYNRNVLYFLIIFIGLFITTIFCYSQLFIFFLALGFACGVETGGNENKKRKEL